MTSMTHGDGGAVCFLEDRYVLGAIIGEGAVGRVHTAFDTVLGIDVAVKIMHDELASSKSIVARFTHEASISARMLSPHVVKVLGLAVTYSGSPCIVYERLEGETLAALISRRGTLTLEETAEIVKQTARALARAHSLGVVHRDVKPDNLFLVRQPDGRPLVKLLDFGVAEAMDPEREGGHVVAGTAEYMAPEILFGSDPLDAKVDIYALGVVAFECLTGRCPFTGSSISEVFAAVQRGTRCTLGQLRPDLTAAVDAWIDSALQPDPFWRMSSVKELARSLDEAMAAPKTARVSLRQAA